MKTKFLFLLLAATVIHACRNSETTYLDLNSNKHVELEKDNETGLMVNTETGAPVDIYVDTKTDDTIYGRTGKVVNGKVFKTEAGQWVVKVDGEEFKAKSESQNSAKIKVEGDEYKMKNGNYTVKREGDGDVKIENGSTQTKIDGETGERKTKKDKNITDKVKNVFD